MTSSTGQVVDYGPDCSLALMERTFTCPTPTYGTGAVDALDENFVALPSGAYDLVVSVGPFPDTHLTVTIP